MESGYQTPISIKEVIDSIVRRKFLIPAIQRKFIWDSEQIERLFDSIMQGYPINSCMFWNIEDERVKNSFKFYEFLSEYRQFFKEDNPEIDTKGNGNFFAIIDGQQRLTSLYIGLKGTYAYKMPRKWWKDNEDSLPTRRLFLDVKQEMDDGDDNRNMKYFFRFLSASDIEKSKNDNNHIWFKVNDILKYSNAEELDTFLDEQGYNAISKTIIRRLRRKVFEDKIINYYLETSQDIDTVLDIFVRTNSGGTPLSFSDLLMSMTTASWTKIDARKAMSQLIKEVFLIGNPNFIIDTDLILKTCLVLFSNDIKFNLKNFTQKTVSTFEDNWDRISESIKAAFKLLDNWQINNNTLRAKNAVIPIVYYIYYHNLEKEINNPVLHKEERKSMRTWFLVSLLKKVFGGQSDNVLSTIRRELRNHVGESRFPYEEIKEAFKGNPNKSYSFDDDDINELLATQKEDSESDVILLLLYSNIVKMDQPLHKDHLHPISEFKNLKESDFSNPSDFQFFTDPNNNNSILNLQLLNGSINDSKNDTPLKDWVKDSNIDLRSRLIPDDVSLDFNNFREFINKRRELLIDKFRNIIQ